MAEKKIKVLVRGALGRVGREVAKAVSLDPELELVVGVDLKAGQGPDNIQIYFDLKTALATYLPNVVVDFSKYDETFMPDIQFILAATTSMVIGTTGIPQEKISEIDQLARIHNVGVIVAPNFSLGAIVMMHLAKIAAKYFEYADITELHHEKKVDAPSGTAVATAKAMVEARGSDYICAKTERENLPGARGAQYGGITIHSVRSPGFMANQEVILGTMGQTLSIRHSQISREGFCPGVIMAIKAVTELKGLTVGIDKLMNL